MIARLTTILYLLCNFVFIFVAGATLYVYSQPTEETPFLDLTAAKSVGLGDYEVAEVLAALRHYDLERALAADVPLSQILAVLVAPIERSTRLGDINYWLLLLAIAFGAWIFGYSFRYVITGSRGILPRL